MAHKILWVGSWEGGQLQNGGLESFNQQDLYLIVAATNAYNKQDADVAYTAAAAVTTTTGPPGTLTDTRQAWNDGQFKHYLVTCNGKTMTVASNSATGLTGTAGWSGGGNPGNGFAYTLAGVTAHGRYAYRPVVAGVGEMLDMIGDYHPRQRDIIWFTAYLAVQGFDNRGNLPSGSDDRYRGPTLGIFNDSTGLNLQLKARRLNGTEQVQWFLYRGDTELGIASAQLTPPTGFVRVQVKYTVSTRAWNTYYNGASQASGTAAVGTTFNEWMTVRNVRRDGKGTDAGPHIIYDSLIVSDAESGDTADALMAVMYQPDCNVISEFTGDFRDVDDDNDDAPVVGDEVDPTATGQMEAFRFKQSTGQ